MRQVSNETAGRVSEADWAKLNAYADGELGEAAREAMARRLAHDPEFARALADVHAAKAAVSLMRPSNITPAETQERFPGLPGGGRRLALAASLAAMLVLGALYGFDGRGGDWRSAPVELHKSFSAEAYALPDAGRMPVISTARIGDLRAVDLSASRLSLVDFRSLSRDERDIVAMHYRGRNGCRVTLVATEARPGEVAPVPLGEGLTSAWNVDSIHYALLAGGMDRARFDAIVAYARAETRRMAPRDELRLAMRSATAKAQPCA